MGAHTKKIWLWRRRVSNRKGSRRPSAGGHCRANARVLQYVRKRSMQLFSRSTLHACTSIFRISTLHVESSTWIPPTFCVQPEHVLVSLTTFVYIFQTRVLSNKKKVLVLGHEGAQTEEQMPYLSCIWPHVLVVQFWGQVSFAGPTVPERPCRV